MEKVILGMDPGTRVMGFGIIMVKNNHISLVQYGVLQLKKYLNHEMRLKKIFEKTLGLIDEYKPDEVAIEAPFFGKNVQSMLKLGRAQGVSMAAVLYRGIPIVEYAPKRIKQAVTGNGNASKEQVARMLKQLLKLDQPGAMLDATDALAVAVCHYFQFKTEIKGKTSWKKFIKDNPDRVSR